MKVKMETIDDILYLTMTNGDKINLINESFVKELKKIKKIIKKSPPKTIILKAENGSKIWSAGHDIDELPEVGNDPLNSSDSLPKIVRAIESFPAPVIALVEGSVWGGANEIVFSCDLVVASKDSEFALTPAKLGLPYSVSGLNNLLKVIPKHILNEMLFTASKISSQRLYEVGAINYIKSDDIHEFTMNLAKNICSNSLLAISSMKETLRVLTTIVNIPFSESQKIEDLRRVAYYSDDYKEGLTAIKNKRKAIFKGKYHFPDD